MRCVDVVGWAICGRAVAAGAFVLLVTLLIFALARLAARDRRQRGPELPIGRTRVGHVEGPRR